MARRRHAAIASSSVLPSRPTEAVGRRSRRPTARLRAQAGRPHVRGRSPPQRRPLQSAPGSEWLGVPEAPRPTTSRRRDLAGPDAVQPKRVPCPGELVHDEIRKRVGGGPYERIPGIARVGVERDGVADRHGSAVEARPQPRDAAVMLDHHVVSPWSCRRMPAGARTVEGTTARALKPFRSGVRAHQPVCHCATPCITGKERSARQSGR